MDFLKLLQQRYTCKYYDKSHKITETDLNIIAESLQLTPSSVNLQPWDFYFVSGDYKDKLRSCIENFNLQRYDNASHVLFICAKTKFTQDYYRKLIEQEKQDGRFGDSIIANKLDQDRRFFVSLRENISEQELYNWNSKQCYIALASALYTASSLGIDSTAIEGFDTKLADRLLDLESKDHSTVVAILLGYHDKSDSNTLQLRPKSRLKDNVHFLN